VSVISQGEEAAAPGISPAARKRAAVETFAQHEQTLRRTARRYSLCADDADDALQRSLEILLTKAPTANSRELIRWTQTVVKHEALAVRGERERTLSGPAAAAAEEGREDWIALLPSEADGPSERAERHEAVARSREALQTLKPQELRALTLLAEGYSYTEIGEITGYSHTKINRCLAEGRERFRSFLSRSEDGQRCTEMGPLISAFCDGEAGEREVAELREHLRACAGCRATLRAYRAAPGAAAALAPTLPFARSLLDRAHELLNGLTSRLRGLGGNGDSTLSQVAASGGTRGGGMAVAAKALAICAGTVGGAAAGVATGVIPAPLDVGAVHSTAPKIERNFDPIIANEWSAASGVEYETAPQPTPDQPEPQPTHHDPAPKPEPEGAPEPSSPPSSGAVEYTAPQPIPTAAPEPSTTNSTPSSSGGNAAGEFGP
jgi:RNA polymerase sigma factor (sigma-70 family)